MGVALNEMRNSLKKSSKREEEDKFFNSGLAQAAEIIRDNSGNESELSERILTFLMDYLKANQGYIFLVNNNEGNTVIELSAAYAFHRKKFLEKKISPGEGLVGQCYMEAQSIYMTDVPDEYVDVRSGVGGSHPRNILLIPIKMDDTVWGILEVASFTVYEPYVIAFLEKVGESIASGIANARTAEHTNNLLQQSQEQSEMLRSQEEELRQNLEELAATQEEMKRKSNELERLLAESKAKEETIRAIKEEVEASKHLLDGVFDNADMMIMATDILGKVVIWNKKAEESLLYAKSEAVANLSGTDFIDKD